MFAQPLAMNQTCNALVRHNHPFFFNLLCKQSMAAMVQAAYGSVFNTIARNTISGSRIVIPAVALRDSFEKWGMPMFELVRTALAESAKLAALRDYHLPRLLSGRVRVDNSQIYAIA